MNKKELIKNIQAKKNFLCIGLDTDLNKIPKHLLKEEDPIYEFNKYIIDATHEYCVAYKPNTAFYEAYGVKGWISLSKTINYITEKYPSIFTIADAKRGDIGNTSSMYARAFFQELNFDAITISPYMGSDSVKPFLEFKNKWIILLAATSNIGATDFQSLSISENNKPLYEQVLETSKNWGTENNTMYVVGATRPEVFKAVRKIIPNHFLLVPGVGAQGGSLQEVCKYGLNNECGLLINSSRNIIYASNEIDFSEKAREEAKKIQKDMEALLF